MQLFHRQGNGIFTFLFYNRDVSKNVPTCHNISFVSQHLIFYFSSFCFPQLDNFLIEIFYDFSSSFVVVSYKLKLYYPLSLNGYFIIKLMRIDIQELGVILMDHILFRLISLLVNIMFMTRYFTEKFIMLHIIIL
jgi:hypothetical protein